MLRSGESAQPLEEQQQQPFSGSRLGVDVQRTDAGEVETSSLQPTAPATEAIEQELWLVRLIKDRSAGDPLYLQKVCVCG